VWDGLTEEIRRATEMVCCAFVILAIAGKNFMKLDWIGNQLVKFEVLPRVKECGS
jgi:hypothetical protein